MLTHRELSTIRPNFILIFNTRPDFSLSKQQSIAQWSPSLKPERQKKQSLFCFIQIKYKPQPELLTTDARFLLILLQQNISNKSQDLYIELRSNISSLLLNKHIDCRYTYGAIYLRCDIYLRMRYIPLCGMRIVPSTTCAGRFIKQKTNNS